MVTLGWDPRCFRYGWGFISRCHLLLAPGRPSRLAPARTSKGRRIRWRMAVEFIGVSVMVWVLEAEGGADV